MKVLQRFLVSVALFPATLIFLNSIFTEDGVAIPVIKADNSPWRMQPEDPGGVVTDKTNYTVGMLVIGNEAEEPSQSIIFADAPTELSDEDLSPREIDALRRTLLNEPPSKKSFNKQNSQSTLINKISNDFGGQGDQLIPEDVKAGPIFVQLGTFNSKTEADNKWRSLNLTHRRDVQGRDWVIQRANTIKGDLYWLRILGFSSWDEAKIFCRQMIVSKAECSPVVSN